MNAEYGMVPENNENPYDPYNTNDPYMIEDKEESFYNLAPNDNFHDPEIEKRIQDERERIARMKAEIEQENYLRENPIVFIDPEDWAPHLPQPLGKCFMCKLKFDPKIKMPLALPCGHNVCRDCVV